MIDEESKELITKLKPYTLSSIESIANSRTPVVIHKSINYSIIAGQSMYETSYINQERYQKILLNLLESLYLGTPKQEARIEALEEELRKNHCVFYNVEKFHYNDNWYIYHYSVDNPNETFGILRVDLPLKLNTPDEMCNKGSFICRMDQMVLTGLIKPFLLFIDGKFVNWNDIDIVYDCNDIFFILHGERYNISNLEFADISMVLIPFGIDFVGPEDDITWNDNYRMLCNYMQDSICMNDSENIEVNVPTMYSIYEANGMVYNIGAWLYTQLKMFKLGLMSSERISKLKKITLTYTKYSENGSAISSKVTKFNALDIDNYDAGLYLKICSTTSEYVNTHALFRFNDDGVLDESGRNIIFNTVEATITSNEFTTGSTIVNTVNMDGYITKDSFLVFSNGIFQPDPNITEDFNNVFTIDNPNLETIKYFIVTDSMINSPLRICDRLPNKEYLSTLNRYNANYNLLLQKAYECLDFEPGNTPEESMENAFNALVDFDPLYFQEFNQNFVKSVTIDGVDANRCLCEFSGVDTRRGLRIPRSKVSDHETFIMVFVNGELIDTYGDMYMSTNFFFLPVNEEFSSGDVIEILFFVGCNNNEIEFVVNRDEIVNTYHGTYSVEQSEFLADTQPPAAMDEEFLNNLDMQVVPYILDGVGITYSAFENVIRPEELKIFAKYPKDVLVYRELLDRYDTSDIAFNISYRNKENQLMVMYRSIMSYIDKFTAVSSRKFIYEKFNVAEKSYKCKLGERFKFCDNQKQYVLFINGLRMPDDSFMVTIPKYSRPFWEMRLYVSSLIEEGDRIELFYLPEEMLNINTTEAPIKLGLNGYVEARKQDLKAPLSPDTYLYFVNGKKIPSSYFTQVSCNRLAITKRIYSTCRFTVNNVNRYIHPALANHITNPESSKYESFIELAKGIGGYELLDELFNRKVKINMIEPNMPNDEVDKIAILNEIIRDFWVSSGYEYNEKPFVYDYDLDEYFIHDEASDLYILPSMDATQEINISKIDSRLLYFRNSHTLNYEIGSASNAITIEWEFTTNQGLTEVQVVSQSVNGEPIENLRRTYLIPATKNNTRYDFSFNLYDKQINMPVDIVFANGVYYGSVDEDLLEWANNNQNKLINIDDLGFVVPDNGEVPMQDEIAGLPDSMIETDMFNIVNLGIAVTGMEDAGFTREIPVSDEINNTCNGVKDLPNLFPRLAVKYQDSPTLDFSRFRIGANKYFVFACPKRVAEDENGNINIVFNMPDINAREVIDYGKDDKTTPVYTNGLYDATNQFIKLDKCEMEFIGEFNYTNRYGVKEPYYMWKTNGFFTRAYDNYQFKMSIRSVEDNYKYNLEESELESRSIEIVNTSSPVGNGLDTLIHIDSL